MDLVLMIQVRQRQPLGFAVSDNEHAYSSALTYVSGSGIRHTGRETYNLLSLNCWSNTDDRTNGGEVYKESATIGASGWGESGVCAKAERITVS